jgi:phenylacetaldehyde dehydrogenase
MSEAWTLEKTLSPHAMDRPKTLFIGGEWVAPIRPDTIPAVDPANGQEIARFSRGGAQDVDRAVRAARLALEAGSWPKMSGQARAKLLWTLADRLEAHRDEFALLETLDVGKPIGMSMAVDVGGAVEKLRYSAGWATKIFGKTFSPTLPGEYHAFTAREPVGVCGLIVAWNFPLGMAVAKMADALAAGCTVVLKPAEQSSLTTLRLGELIEEIGFPAGVVNIVTGYGPEVGQALADHPDVDKISFTGSTATGKRLVAACAGNLKRLTVELGGKSPAVVFADSDFEVAVQGVFRNIFYNTGQICAAGSRAFVQRTIYDKMVAALAEKAQALRVGPGVEPSSELGPLISDKQLERVTGYVESGLEAGAKLVTGGARLGSQGYFMEPTILADTDRTMRVRQEEIFGPVLCIMPFDDDDLDQLAKSANDTDYGLNAFIYTRDLSRAHRLARKIKAGVVRVNGAGIDPTVPFGGYKQSGWGREQGEEGVLGFTELKSVVMAL